MRTFRTSIGLMTSLALSAGTMLCFASTTFAAESTSYTLQSDSTAATNQLGISASYAMNESQTTWIRLAAVSTSFQIVPPMNVSTTASNTASSESTSNTNGGTVKKAGSRGDRIPVIVVAPEQTPVLTPSLHPAPESKLIQEPVYEPIRFEEPAPLATPARYTSTYTIASTHGVMTRSMSPGIHFLDVIDPLCHDDEAKNTGLQTMGIASMIGGSMLLGGIAGRRKRHKKTLRKKQKSDLLAIRCLLMLAMGLFVFGSFVVYASAAQTVPTKHVYNGRLLDSAGSAITTAHTIRFSYWKNTDAVAGDTTGTGAINTGASNYAGWQETHTVTPNALGYFSVELGSVTAFAYQSLPASTLISLFLQVDVKVSGTSDTTYEMLDIDSTDTTIDRSGMLSMPFASNADMIDEREIGTSSGSIAILGPNGQFNKSTIAGGTNSGTFLIDADSTESSEIVLQFGGTLAKKLTYDIVNSVFKFNASLQVQGNLTVTGLINGINLTQLQSSTGTLKASSGGGLNLNVSYGSYRLNGNITNYGGGSITMPASTTSYVFFGSGGLTTRTTSFPIDESYIPVAEVTTSLGSILSVLDRRALSTDDRERTISQTFNPSYEKASYSGDGTSNIGQLSILHDTGSLKNFYSWTSTRSSLQDYDILLKVPVTDDFVRWQTSGGVNPIALTYRSTSASSATSKLDIQIYDTNGTAVTLSGSVTNLASTAWTTTQVEFTGSPTWTQGGDMLIRLKASAKDNASMHISSLKLTFTELLKE